MPYTFTRDLAADITPPEKGILSRTLHKDDAVGITLCGFAPGEELSAHTAPHPAVFYFLRGEAKLRLGDYTMDTGPRLPGTHARPPAACYPGQNAGHHAAGDEVAH